MKKTARFLRVRGFTFVELIVVVGILAILVGLGTPYLFGAREKLFLETEQEKILNHLKIAQQKAIAAYQGYDYTLEFAPPHEYRLQPENQLVTLDPKTELLSVDPETITFARLSGKPCAAFHLVLASKRFQADIIISSEGVITTTPPIRRR